MEIYVILGLIFLLAAYLLFWKKQTPIVDITTSLLAYKNILTEKVDFYQKLDEDRKVKFEELVVQFITYIRIEGVGTTITDLDRVLIASSAIIPVFGFPEWQYRNLTNVVLYPDTFDKDYQFEGESRNIMGMVGTGYLNGQMLLSRQALIKGFSAAAGHENAAIHEFVHLLDKSDGATDGIPENLLSHEYAVPWLKMMHQEMRRIEAGKSDINPYAITNEAEFLAVASEYFFEKPELFQQMHPELHEMLSRMFNKESEATN